MLTEISYNHPLFRQRAYTLLEILAKDGISLQVELAYRFGATSSNPNFNRLIKRLCDHDLIITHTLPLGVVNKVSVVQLTDYGKERMAQMGVPPIESEYERILRLHDGANQPKHTAQVLFTAYQARIRGLKVSVMPFEKDDGTPWYQPDLEITNGYLTYPVEVETHSRNKPEKWLYKREANVVLPNPKIRQLVVERLKRLGVPGRATDLRTLALLHRRGNLSTFWLERW